MQHVTKRRSKGTLSAGEAVPSLESTILSAESTVLSATCTVPSAECTVLRAKRLVVVTVDKV
jgi:hypothetical protein